MHLTFRVPTTMPAEERAGIVTRLTRAFENYANSSPIEGVRQQPQILIEPFESQRPYTDSGKVVSHIDREPTGWWQGATNAMADALHAEFPDRGVALYYDREGSCVRRQPKHADAA